ncbi:MAG TPA: hypothetical protein VGK22_06970 [Candidatus Angelobacter sp.]
MIETIIMVVASIGGLLWLLYLLSRRSSLASPITSFDINSPRLNDAECEIVLIEYIRQLKWAFGLLWFAIALGIALGGFLFGRLFISAEFSLDDLASVITTVGDISLAAGAFKLYRTSGKQLQHFLETIREQERKAASTETT